MGFRPHILMSVLSLMALAVLCALGWWQLERLAWKEELIASAEERSSGAPVPLDEFLAATPESEWEYAAVSATGTFDHTREIHVFGQDLDGNIGWYIFTPLLREGAPAVVINRGFVLQALKDPATRAEGQVADVVSITGLVRRNGESNAFTPPSNAAENEWYTRDLPAMREAMGLPDAVPVFIDANETAPGGWPMGGQTRLEFTNNHFGYALTWFGLALTLIGVYIAYHWQTGRIGRRKS